MNVVKLIDDNAKAYGGREAVCDSKDSYTFLQIKEHSENAAACFKARGIGKGDAVAIMGQNSLDFVVAMFGVLKAGGVVVPVNHKLTAGEVDYILGSSRAKLFLFDGSLEAVTRSLTVAIPALSLNTPTNGFDFFQDKMASAPAFEPMAIDDDDVAEILYTSGTTGKPKGCVHTHRSVTVAGITGVNAINLTASDRMLIAMPIWHSSPLNNWFMGITIAGGTAVLLREYHPQHFLTIIQAQRCTVYFGAPISYLMPLQMIPNFGDYDLSSMRAWIYGGGPIAPETVKKLVHAYRSDRFYQVYGMTESGPTGTVLTPGDHREKSGSIGNRPLPGASMKVMKTETLQAGPGDTGEIWLKSESMMMHYLDNPTATQEAFHDGWYRTGDLARIDEQGYLFIVDRIKDMVVTGGENVYSKEVEDQIIEHPGVNDVAVIGSTHPQWGETVTAVIVPAGDAQLTPEALKEFLSGRLAKYKIPRIFHFAAGLPRTPSGKVMKFKLKQEYNSRKDNHHV